MQKNKNFKTIYGNSRNIPGFMIKCPGMLNIFFQTASNKQVCRGV